MNKQSLKHLLYTALIGGGIWYFILVPFHFQSFSFYIFIIFLLTLYGLFESTFTHDKKMIKFPKYIFPAIGYIVLGIILINMVFSPLFQSKSYANWTTIEDGIFKDQVEPADLNNLTLIDKESSMRLGDRVLGDIPEFVSQFSVSDQYTTVTYNGHLYRVTPLEYSSFIKFFANKKEGTPGYIMVDSTTGEAKLIRVKNGLHYLKSAYFSNDLRRHLVTNFPNKLLGPSHFEIDENQQPFYVTPVYKTSGIGLKKDVAGIILTNASSGENSYYAFQDIPEWIDHVIPSELAVEKINSALKYQNGFWNTIFGQKNVRQLTPDFTIKNEKTDESISYVGYQYLALKNDVCLYSGVTSTTNDDSNLGFIISNLRTGKTTYYPCSGAEEYSAMASARGLVQEKGYDATFPLLVNLYDRPTYIVTLKDAAGLVKMYAFVDPQDYQQVYAGDSKDGIQSVCNGYLQMLNIKPSNKVDQATLTQKEGKIVSYRTIVDNGNTYYYFLLEGSDTIYRVPATLDPFLDVQQNISFMENDDHTVQKILK